MSKWNRRLEINSYNGQNKFQQLSRLFKTYVQDHTKGGEEEEKIVKASSSLIAFYLCLLIIIKPSTKSVEDIEYDSASKPRNADWLSDRGKV